MSEANSISLPKKVAQMLAAAEAKQITPFTANERTWYGFFMECFESLKEFFYPTHQIKQSHADVYLVFKGRYYLTEERLQEWRSRFSFISWENPLIPDVSHMLTPAQTIAIQILAELRSLNHLPTILSSLPQGSLPTQTRHSV